MKFRNLIKEDISNDINFMPHNEINIIIADFDKVIKYAKTVSLNGSVPFLISELEYTKNENFPLFSYGEHIWKTFTSIPPGIELKEMKLLNKDIIYFYM